MRCGLSAWPPKCLTSRGRRALRADPSPLGRPVPPGPWSVLFCSVFEFFFLVLSQAGTEGRAVVNATLAQAIHWRIFLERFEPLRKVVSENLLGALGFAQHTPPQLKLKFERK